MKPEGVSPISSRVFIRIADIVFSLAASSPSLEIAVAGATRKSLVASGEPDLRIDARWDDLSAIKNTGEEVFTPGKVWKLCRQNGTLSFMFYSPVFGSNPYKLAQIKEDFSRAKVLIHKPYSNCDRGIYPLQFPLDELLFTHVVSLGKGAEIHAGGLVDGVGRGHLFVGHSGAGKTTITRLWEDEPGVTILSDDRIALRMENGEVWMHGTPWHGDAGFSSPTRAPLNRIYFLGRGQRNETAEIRRSEAAVELFSRAFLPLYNPRAVEFTLSFFDRVVKAIPCFELKFVPDKGVVEFVEELQD